MDAESCYFIWLQLQIPTPTFYFFDSTPDFDSLVDLGFYFIVGQVLYLSIVASFL